MLQGADCRLVRHRHLDCFSGRAGQASGDGARLGVSSVLSPFFSPFNSVPQYSSPR